MIDYLGWVIGFAFTHGKKRIPEALNRGRCCGREMVCAPEYTAMSDNESEHTLATLQSDKLDKRKYTFFEWHWRQPPGFCGRAVQPLFAVYLRKNFPLGDEFPESGSDNPHSNNPDCLATMHADDGWMCHRESFRSVFEQLRNARGRPEHKNCRWCYSRARSLLQELLPAIDIYGAARS